MGCNCSDAKDWIKYPSEMPNLEHPILKDTSLLQTDLSQEGTPPPEIELLLKKRSDQNDQENCVGTGSLLKTTAKEKCLDAKDQMDKKGSKQNDQELSIGSLSETTAKAKCSNAKDRMDTPSKIPDIEHPILNDTSPLETDLSSPLETDLLQKKRSEQNDQEICVSTGTFPPTTTKEKCSDAKDRMDNSSKISDLELSIVKDTSTLETDLLLKDKSPLETDLLQKNSSDQNGQENCVSTGSLPQTTVKEPCSWQQPELEESSSNVKVIAMWTQKGGVGKTTNVYHMAFEMASSGKKVIMVDADPQCTLSDTCCSTANDTSWRASEERGDLPSAWEAAYTSIIEGREVLPASLAIPDRSDLCTSNGGSLLLLPGSLESYQLDHRLVYAQDLKQRSFLDKVNGWGKLREAVGVMRILLKVTAVKYGADVVLIDMGPSICDLNFNILFSSDYFVVPVNPDRSYKSSLCTIARVLEDWAQDYKKIVNFKAEYKCNMKTIPPKFAGVLFSAVPQSTQNKPMKDYAKWMKECCSVIEQILLPKLHRYNMVARNIGVLEAESFILEQIPMFTKVHEMAKRCFAPVFGMEPTLVTDVDSMGKDKLLTGKALKTALEKGEQYRQYFVNLNKRLFKVTATESN